MESEEIDVLRIVLEQYVLDLMRNMSEKPKRFSELTSIIHNERTLSLKLVKLMDYGLIESVPIKRGRKHINYYKVSKRGKKVLDVLDNLEKLK